MPRATENGLDFFTKLNFTPNNAMIELTTPQPSYTTSSFKCGETLNRSGLSVPSFLRKRSLPLWDDVEHAPVKKRKLRKTVGFADKDKVQHQHCTEEDIQNAWYSNLDYKSFTDECRDTLKKVDAVNGNVDRLDLSEICMRGLETQIIPQVFHLKRRRKKLLIGMVVRQHELHKMTGNRDDGKLRAISLMFSKHSREWGIELGALDRAFIAVEESR
jgi:hypothetical protein